MDYRWHQPDVNHPVQHSGLTPRAILFGQSPLTPLSYFKEEEYLEYQREYLKALTSRDLFDLRVLDWPGLPDGSLRNEIHPIFHVRILLGGVNYVTNL